MSNDFWILYDPRNKTQTEQLSTEQAQFSLMKMKTKEINNFLIFKSNWDKWQKLRDFLTSDNSPFMSTFFGKSSSSEEVDTPSSLAMKPVDKETEKKIQASFSNVTLEEVDISKMSSGGQQQFDGDQLNTESDVKSTVSFKGLDSKTAFSKSNSPEDKFKIELLLIHPKGAMFRTIARDISLSGTFADKIVPDEFHHTVFDLVIINNFIPDAQYKRLNLKAKVQITDSAVYLQYSGMTEPQKQNLRSILEYYVRSLKKLSA
ncbi:hypothetical protein K2P97_10745 [bacterium]|nr:hypothetical protein [bacterium]